LATLPNISTAFKDEVFKYLHFRVLALTEKRRCAVLLRLPVRSTDHPGLPVNGCALAFTLHRGRGE
jgi:hypothetical protein